MPARHPRSTRTLTIIGVVAAGLALGGCMTRSDPVTTGSIARASPSDAQAAYNRNPKNARAALALAEVMQNSGQEAQALQILDRAAQDNPRNRDVSAAYGRALARAGQAEPAIAMIRRALDRANPDWRLLNIQGVMYDQIQQPALAEQHYLEALKIAPDEPSVLANLGLSYALQKRLAEAEKVLARAAVHPQADAQVRQNYALVLGLNGKYAEAEKIARQDLSAEDAAANARMWRRGLSTGQRG